MTWPTSCKMCGAVGAFYCAKCQSNFCADHGPAHEAEGRKAPCVVLTKEETQK